MKCLWLLFLALPLSAQEAKIVTTPPVIAVGYNTSEAFVIGKDMKTRHCPADYNLYVRRESDKIKPPDKNLYYVMPKTVLTPQPDLWYDVLCVKEIQ